MHPRPPRPLSTTALLLVALVLAAPAEAAKKKKPADAPPEPCDRCSDLRRLQKELAEQEFLRSYFESYLTSRLPPKPKDASDDRSTIQRMQDDAQAKFIEWLHSPPGGGSGSGQAEAATDLDTCQLMLPVQDANGQNRKNKDGTIMMKVVKQAEVRKKHCKALADMILTHEGQHQTDCKANKASETPLDMTNYRNFAVYDARGYSAGIASLRKSIAALARKCGWKGTAVKVKRPLPQVPTDPRKDTDEEPVPSPEQLDALANAIAGGKAR